MGEWTALSLLLLKNISRRLELELRSRQFFLPGNGSPMATNVVVVVVGVVVVIRFFAGSYEICATRFCVTQF